MHDKLHYIAPATVPSRLTTYLPVKPEAPNTVTTSPLNEERPPVPRLVWLDTLLTNCNEFETADSLRTSVHFVAAIFLSANRNFALPCLCTGKGGSVGVAHLHS